MLKLLIIASCLYSSIYSIHFNSITGDDQNFGQYQGKKILIVNIATGSDKVSQIGQLEELYQQYHDSLVIIAFPSNSFGNEPKTNAEIKQLCEGVFHTTFPLAQKGAVMGTNAVPIYQWLASQAENGVMNGTVVQDFQKFLVDKNGALIGVFGPETDPMSTAIREAITEN
jgi:glutathione peroxidase